MKTGTVFGKLVCLLLVLLLLPVSVFAEADELTPQEIPEGFEPSDPSAQGDDEGSFGASTGLPGMSKENFSADELPDGYLDPCDQPGRVEKVRYTYRTSEGKQVKIATVYLPCGYDDNEDKYNVLYILHASGGKPQNYLNPEKETDFSNLLDHMIANGDVKPLIVVAATYYPTESFIKYMPLDKQVESIADFPQEMVEGIIPAVEKDYRVWAESLDIEGIIASRSHRGVAGFSLGGVATWNIFQQEMRAFRWFLPISEASWSDAEGGTSGIWDSDVSAQVLYDAVLSQGYDKDGFRLFVATGTDDEAFSVSTSQMVSLLEYNDIFVTGENTSCSMMSGGTHTMSAVYTYLYFILPALFVD